MSLFTSESAKLATQKKEEMKQERQDKTEAEYGEGGEIILERDDIVVTPAFIDSHSEYSFLI